MTIVSVRVKRHRKPSLGAALKQAKAAGQAVRGAVIRSDAIELQFASRRRPPALKPRWTSGSTSMRIRLKGLNSVTKKLADRTRRTYWYAWKGGPPLPGEPGTPQFMAAYNEAVARKVVPPTGTLISLLHQYQASDDFLRLADETRRGYVKMITRTKSRRRSATSRSPLSLTAGRAGYSWRGAIAKCALTSRRQADYGWTVLSRVLSWALDRGLVAINPCERGGRLYRGSRAERASGRPTTRPPSSDMRAAPISICRCCWRCGPGSGKATCCGLPWSGYDGIAYPVAAGEDRSARADRCRSAPRRRPRSSATRRRAAHRCSPTELRDGRGPSTRGPSVVRYRRAARPASRRSRERSTTLRGHRTSRALAIVGCAAA